MSKTSTTYYHENIKTNPDYMEYKRIKKQNWYLENKEYVSEYYKIYREINKEKLNLNNMIWRLEQKESAK